MLYLASYSVAQSGKNQHSVYLYVQKSDFDRTEMIQALVSQTVCPPPQAECPQHSRNARGPGTPCGMDPHNSCETWIIPSGNLT